MSTTLHRTAVYLLWLTGFSLPISIAGVNTLLPLITVLSLWILWHEPKHLNLASHPVVLTSWALWLWGLLAISYSLLKPFAALQTLLPYLEFFYLPFMLLLFQNPHRQRWGIHCFMIGLLVVLLGAYFVWLTGIPLGKATAENPVIFKNYISQGILFCVGAVLLLWYWQEYPRWRALITVLLLLILYNILFIGQGRSAYIIVLMLMLWRGFIAWRWRGLLLAILGVGLLALSAYHFSDSTRLRIQQTWQNIQAYDSQQPAHTSVGYRLEFYYHSLQLVAQRPWLGTGTGGFTPAYTQLTANKNMIMCENPHNEYLLITVQWGLPGLCLFLLFLAVLFFYSPRLGAFSQPAQGLLLIILVGNLFNSLWLDFTEGHTFAYFIGLFYARLGVSWSPRFY